MIDSRSPDELAGAHRRLATYLQDHHAAAAAGERLAQRCADSNSDDALGAYLRDEVLPAIAFDRTVLRQALDASDVRPSPLKDLGARLGELVARTKPNGQLTGYSPLSRVIELEALLAGITAKRALWVTLDRLRREPGHEALPDVGALIAAADEQRDRLSAHHERAVLAAFASDRDAKAANATPDRGGT